jgi:hypothetical protein
MFVPDSRPYDYKVNLQSVVVQVFVLDVGWNRIKQNTGPVLILET